jgi:F-box and WD-40 domain protein CDC4
LSTYSTSDSDITSAALDADWVVVGLANGKILVFGSKTGVLNRTLVGHESGVWAVNLVSQGGFLGGSGNGNECSGRPSREDVTDMASGKRPGKKSNMCGASEGWGQPYTLLVSGGCDKVLRLWDVNTG